RYRTTYQDLSVPVDGFSMQVRRTYDNTDKNQGDFGVGWRLELADIRVISNRVLGAGGWTVHSVSCGFFFCWSATNPSARYVTVTYADGRSEIFDFTPGLGRSVFVNVAAAVTPRPGT